MIIKAPFTEEQFIKFGKFLRDLCKDTKEGEACFVNIVEGTENYSKEDLLKIMRKIFEGSSEYHEITITKDKIEEFHKRVGSNEI
jgi:hypothetical protein